MKDILIHNSIKMAKNKFIRMTDSLVILFQV